MRLIAKGLCATCYGKSRRATGVCVRCSKERPIVGRGACGSCFKQLAQVRKTCACGQACAVNNATGVCRACWKTANRARAKWSGKSIRARLRQYGISERAFVDLYERQNGICKCCDEPLVFEGRNTHVDHCHSTGVIRGLLCATCNVGLGSFRDDPVRLQKAIAYLTTKEHTEYVVPEATRNQNSHARRRERKEKSR